MNVTQEILFIILIVLVFSAIYSFLQNSISSYYARKIDEGRKLHEKRMDEIMRQNNV